MSSLFLILHKDTTVSSDNQKPCNSQKLTRTSCRSQGSLPVFPGVVNEWRKKVRYSRSFHSYRMAGAWPPVYERSWEIHVRVNSSRNGVRILRGLLLCATKVALLKFVHLTISTESLCRSDIHRRLNRIYHKDAWNHLPNREY